MKTLAEMLTANDVPTLFTENRKDVVPMTEEQSKVFIMFSMGEMKGRAGAPIPADQLEAEFQKDREKLPFDLAVMVKRLAVCAPDLTFSPNVVLFCTLLSPNVASVVMWAYSLVRETRRRQGKPIMIADFAELAPWGVPTEEFYHRVWRSQKVTKDGGGDLNYLDHTRPWEAETSVEPA